MKKECKHINKAYSNISFANNNGTTSPWICKDCGSEGNDFAEYYFNNEYEQAKQKFRKPRNITI